MPNCFDIQHVAGYNEHGNWIEQYYWERSDGQVFVFMENYPPVGERSRTPPYMVGDQNGFCTFDDLPKSETGQATTEQVVSSELSTVEPGSLPGGAILIVIIAACVAGGVAINNHKEERSQKRYDRAADRARRQPEPVEFSDQKPKAEDDLILDHLYRQSPAPKAVKAIWGVEQDSPRYATKLRMFQECRREFEDKYPAAKEIQRHG